MTVQLLQVADLHFGGLCEIRQIEALEAMIADLRPDAVVVAGDVSQRARHGEFQRARAFVHAARHTAPVLVIPGNHDVGWWWRPLIPFAKDVLYAKYRRYFGDNLAPALTIPGGAVIAAALTSHGVAWGSLTWNLRDLTVKGHLPEREIARVPYGETISYAELARRAGAPGPAPLAGRRGSPGSRRRPWPDGMRAPQQVNGQWLFLL